MFKLYQKHLNSLIIWNQSGSWEAEIKVTKDLKYINKIHPVVVLTLIPNQYKALTRDAFLQFLFLICSWWVISSCFFSISFELQYQKHLTVSVIFVSFVIRFIAWTLNLLSFPEPLTHLVVYEDTFGCMVFQPNDLPTNRSEFLCWFNYLPLFSFLTSVSTGKMVPWCQEFTIFPRPKTSTSGATQLKEQCQVTRQNWLDAKTPLAPSSPTSLTHPVQQTPNVLQVHLLIFTLCSLPLCLCKCLPGLLQSSFTVLLYPLSSFPLQL